MNGSETKDGDGPDIFDQSSPLEWGARSPILPPGCSIMGSQGGDCDLRPTSSDEAWQASGTGTEKRVFPDKSTH
jgi:hypothetical protein